jgi:hypothetical protein
MTSQLPAENPAHCSDMVSEGDRWFSQTEPAADGTDASHCPEPVVWGTAPSLACVVHALG